MIARPLCLSLVALVLLTWTPTVGCEPANVAAVNNPTSAGGREYPPNDLSDVANNGIRERRGLPQEDISDDSEEEEDDEAVRDEHDVLAGFPLDDLDDDGLQALLDIDDEIFYDQAGEWACPRLQTCFLQTCFLHCGSGRGGRVWFFFQGGAKSCCPSSISGLSTFHILLVSLHDIPSNVRDVY